MLSKTISNESFLWPLALLCGSRRWTRSEMMSQSFPSLTSPQTHFYVSPVSPPIHPTDLSCWIEFSLPQTFVRVLMAPSAHITHFARPHTSYSSPFNPFPMILPELCLFDLISVVFQRDTLNSYLSHK